MRGKPQNGNAAGHACKITRCHFLERKISFPFGHRFNLATELQETSDVAIMARSFAIKLIVKARGTD